MEFLRFKQSTKDFLLTYVENQNFIFCYYFLSILKKLQLYSTIYWYILGLQKTQQKDSKKTLLPKVRKKVYWQINK